MPNPSRAEGRSFELQGNVIVVTMHEGHLGAKSPRTLLGSTALVPGCIKDKIWSFQASVSPCIKLEQSNTSILKEFITCWNVLGKSNYHHLEVCLSASTFIQEHGCLPPLPHHGFPVLQSSTSSPVILSDFLSYRHTSRDIFVCASGERGIAKISNRSATDWHFLPI